ncbi:hypothetical protein Tco_0366902 [Tanacetum coccineum]
MDLMISLGQKNTLAEYMILFGADNRPPMLNKDMYDSWKSIMELYMQNREHGRMILESVEHGLPVDIYSLVNHHRVAKDLWERVQLLMQDTSLTKQEREFNTKFLNSLPPEWNKFVTDVKLVKDLHTSNFDQLHAYLEQHELHANEVRFVVPVFSPGDDPIACLNKALLVSNGCSFGKCNKFREDKGKIIMVILIRAMLLVQGEILQVDRQELLNAITAKVKDIWLGNATQGPSRPNEMQHNSCIPADQAQIIIPHNAAFQNEDLDTYDLDCDDLSTA